MYPQKRKKNSNGLFYLGPKINRPFFMADCYVNKTFFYLNNYSAPFVSTYCYPDYYFFSLLMVGNNNVALNMTIKKS